MFFDRFERLCEQKGLSCGRATLEIGLSNATATKWKKTGATPNGETLGKIANYFSVSVDYLLDVAGQAAIDDIMWKIKKLKDYLNEHPGDEETLYAIDVLEESADDLMIANSLITGEEKTDIDRELESLLRNMSDDDKRFVIAYAKGIVDHRK